MHELSVVFHIIKSLEDVAEENHISKIGSVTLEIGEVSFIVPDYLSDCWRWACDRTELMKGAELIVETIPAITYCESCEKTYETVAHGKTCPHCGSGKTYLLQGTETNIKEIEAY